MSSQLESGHILVNNTYDTAILMVNYDSIRNISILFNIIGKAKLEERQK